MVNFIPEDERLLTIEDVREMFLPNHPNRVHLLYSEGGQGTAEITGKTLLQACLRMKPDRVLLAELRSKVAYDYIVNISSGHPGSITTVHAGSAAGAFEMLMLRVKESDEGQSLERARHSRICCEQRLTSSCRCTSSSAKDADGKTTARCVGSPRSTMSPA